MSHEVKRTCSSTSRTHELVSVPVHIVSVINISTALQTVYLRFNCHLTEVQGSSVSRKVDCNVLT